jgi:hypothetical protein
MLKPIVGTKFGLFPTTNCTGSPLTTGTDDAHGVFDFTHVPDGSYSVSNTAPPGYTTTEHCQPVDLSSSPVPTTQQKETSAREASGAGFPAAGEDRFFSFARVDLTLGEAQTPVSVALSGPTVIARETAHLVKGRNDITTRMVALNLTGSIPGMGIVTVQLRKSPQSKGSIQALAKSRPFPATSFFNVWFELRLTTQAGTSVFTTRNAIHMSSVIDAIPPLPTMSHLDPTIYSPDNSVPVPLYDSRGNQVGAIAHAAHVPVPGDPPLESCAFFESTPTTATTPRYRRAHHVALG